MKRLITLLFIAFFLVFAACGTHPAADNVAIPSQPSPPAPEISPEPTLTPTPALEPTPEPTPEPDPIDVLISDMSDSELIGQMVMIGFTGTNDMDKKSRELMQKYHVGNIILFGWNTDTFSQTAKLTEKIKSYNNSSIPVLISIDVEGGRVLRFKGWKPRIKSALNLKNKQTVYNQYKQIGDKLLDIGITLNLAPVLDISKDPMSTFIKNRMFGSDPDKVSLLITQAIQAMHDAGIVCAGKHFPGHGETAKDSHKELAVVKTPLDDMEEYSLVPFKAAVEQGVDAMLVAHILYPKIDSGNPASLSYTWITQILREDMGFDGVVISDDLRMQGLLDHCSVGEGAVKHILAGGDIVLIGKQYNMQVKVLEALNKACEEGTISRERLEQSVRRILKMKLKYSPFL